MTVRQNKGMEDHIQQQQMYAEYQRQQKQLLMALRLAEDVLCDNCGNAAFHEAILLKKISAIAHPQGREEIVPIKVYSCGSCGYIRNPFEAVLNADESNQKDEEESTPKIVTSDTRSYIDEL